MALPDGFVVVCDSAFMTSGKLKGKIVKLKETNLENGDERTDKDKALTHIRQCAEWDNNVLTESFRRLRVKIPTSNLKRALLQWPCLLLHNWRTETCSRNQIKTYFENLQNEDKD